MTRGPLPPRVYWRRRLLALLLVVGLVVGTARLLTLGSDGSDPETPQANQVAAESTGSVSDEESAEPSSEESTGPVETTRGRPEGRKRSRKDPEPVLADPEGACADRDIAVTPSVRKPEAGRPVTFALELRTITSAACTWEVSPSTLTLKITSGSDDIWSSQHCPRAIPREQVVVRNNVSTEVAVTWSGRRSDEECSRLTKWALPGWYFVNAAALAGEPSDLHFELLKPEPEVVTRTVEPKKRDRDRKDRPTRDRKRSGRG